MPLGQILQIIGALRSPNRPEGIGGIATAVTSPNTLLSMDLEQSRRQKYGQAILEPELKASRELVAKSSLLGDLQTAAQAQQNIALELQRRGFNPDIYFKTEGLMYDAIGKQAKAAFEQGRD